MTLRNQQLAHYKNVLRRWKTQYAGEKPSEELITTAHALGCRPGIQALSIAMALRDTGYTIPEYFVGTGAAATAHNKRNDLESQGLITVVKVGSPMSYRASLTSVGVERVKQFKIHLDNQKRGDAN